MKKIIEKITYEDGNVQYYPKVKIGGRDMGVYEISSKTSSSAFLSIVGLGQKGYDSQELAILRLSQAIEQWEKDTLQYTEAKKEIIEIN